MISRKTAHKLIFLNFTVFVVAVAVAFVSYKKTTDTQNENFLKSETEPPITESTPVGVVQPTKTPTPSPTVLPKATTPKVIPPKDTRCLITISGKVYNVTNFRDSHSGGNVFKCGTDMTSVFKSQHGSSILKKMEKYLVK